MVQSTSEFCDKRDSYCKIYLWGREIFCGFLIPFFFVKNAEKCSYAVGAFNVYNLEGIEAVIAAAEAERSPAILQVRNL